ncbi:zinc ribbon domain-containing protein, partial [Phormidesmis priestleyi]
SMSKATVLFELQPTSIRHRPGSHPDAPPKRVERVALPPILLNRSILEVGFGIIGKMFEYKLAEAGGFYVESPTRQLKPSQRCAKCWELTPKTLANRVHGCSNPKCGHTEDRDINAAQVNLIWAQGARTVLLDAESPSSTNCGSMRQLGAKKCQKLQAAGEAETTRSACGG